MVAEFVGTAFLLAGMVGSGIMAETLSEAARTLSDTFAGIEAASAPMFVLMQVVGAGLAVATVRRVHEVLVAERAHHVVGAGLAVATVRLLDPALQ